MESAEFSSLQIGHFIWNLCVSAGMWDVTLIADEPFEIPPLDLYALPMLLRSGIRVSTILFLSILHPCTCSGMGDTEASENRDAKAGYFLHPYLSEFFVASKNALLETKPPKR
jgi:hypothetical protein